MGSSCNDSSGDQGDPVQQDGMAYVIAFESMADNTLYPGVLININGGHLVPDGVNGKALNLAPGEYLVLDAKRLINPEKGTIFFWVRPHWNDAEIASHTYISFPWRDGRSGYFTLSRGWWEPAGARLTYLIGNNQDFSNIARHIHYEKGVWTHLACVWESGNPGFIKLYVNGILAAVNKKYTGKYSPGGALYLGSDNGTFLSADRFADADFDELTFYRKALTDADILDIYNRQTPISKYPLRDAAGTFLETRAVFDEGSAWQTESGARETIRRVKQAGFNVYIPCVWHGNGTRYPSTQTTAERSQRFVGRDPLERLIAIAHENGIQVHPWFTVTLREKQFALDHRDLYDAATPANAFDLHRPIFQRFIVELIIDVARRYAIDGVNLDYIRSMGICKCAYCLQEYQRIYNRDLLYDSTHPNADRTIEPHLQDWQDKAVEQIVRKVSAEVKKIRPGCVISVDGQLWQKPNPEGRQEANWANTGLVDLVFDMNYTQPPDTERHNLMLAKFLDPSKLIMLISNYDSIRASVIPISADQLQSTVDYVRRRWGNGIGIYIYSMLNDDQMAMLARGPFREAALPQLR